MMKKRKWRSAEEKRLALELKSDWERLVREKHPPNVDALAELKQNPTPYTPPTIRRQQINAPGVIVRVRPKLPTPKAQQKQPPRLEGDMLEREKAAQQEIERKKQRVAPLYNKGGLQFITDDTDLTTLGRKV